LARKILLADDSVTAQNMGRKILADAGYEVITVNNGSAALKKIAEQKPDLIVLDVYMPGYSGLEVCQRLKEAQETARVPVLLTVGKLEPFKPEEAKRVRADGFIVKPFEASELLSALSKLEDKIVPRGEASKPGRFARVTAAIDEGRYDKTVAITEDVGWKNRISFPSKKDRLVPEEGESAAIYKPVEKPRPTKVEEAKVDLGALAPEGLPKDVTPEEIAALAAAAAQMKGKIAESSSLEGTENIGLAAPIAEQTSEVRSSEAGFDEKPAGKIEEKSGTPREKSTEAAAEADGVAAASHSDLMAAIVGLDPNAAALPGTNSERGFSSPDAPPQAANEPVTMALAAGANSVTDAPRWTAVSVALGKEEAAISLENEMQKAYAAFAAAVNGHMSSASVVPEASSDSARVVAPTDSSSVPQAGKPEPVIAIPALPAPEAVQTLSSPLGNASTEAIRAAVQELEMVAESFVGEAAPPAGVGSAPMAEAATPSQLAPAVSPAAEGTTKDTWGSKADEPQREAGKLDSAKPEERASWRPEPANQGWNKQSAKSEGQTYAEQQNDRWKKEVPFVAGAPEAPEKHETETHEFTSSNFVNAVPAEQTSASELSSSAESAATAEGSGEMAKKESDAAASTAAAWASWRQIRESGDSKAASNEPTQKEVEQRSTPQDAAAMAVAAGAEKTPEPADSQSDPAAIASIVDSVLADLRPKIFEEISRKMGKK
jgi:two-component system chemotaxis response regulator CheY